jgi:hypothetical protein
MTSFDEIIDLALITVNDYRLSKLAEQGETEFNTYVDGFLISAIPNFSECRQSLDYNLETREFNSDLTTLEKSILANLWIIQWYARDNQTYALYRQHLQAASSFKNHSESQNLKENSTYLDKLREELDRQKITYQLQDFFNI